MGNLEHRGISMNIISPVVPKAPLAPLPVATCLLWDNSSSLILARVRKFLTSPLPRARRRRAARLFCRPRCSPRRPPSPPSLSLSLSCLGSLDSRASWRPCAPGPGLPPPHRPGRGASPGALYNPGAPAPRGAPEIDAPAEGGGGSRGWGGGARSGDRRPWAREAGAHEDREGRRAGGVTRAWPPTLAGGDWAPARRVTRGRVFSEWGRSARISVNPTNPRAQARPGSGQTIQILPARALARELTCEVQSR